mgnify:FL=1
MFYMNVLKKDGIFVVSFSEHNFVQLQRFFLQKKNKLTVGWSIIFKDNNLSRLNVRKQIYTSLIHLHLFKNKC